MTGGGPGDRRGGPPEDRGVRRVQRRPTDLIWLAAGAVGLVLCALPVPADLAGDAAAPVPDARKVA
jgi:hypothetical protein